MSAIIIRTPANGIQGRSLAEHRDDCFVAIVAAKGMRLRATRLPAEDPNQAEE